MLIQTKLNAAECFLQHHNVVSELTTQFGDISAGVARGRSSLWRLYRPLQTFYNLILETLILDCFAAAGQNRGH